MSHIRIWLAALVLAATTNTVHAAAFSSGNQLMEKLRHREAVERLEAAWYIAGAVDALRGNGHCAPQSVTLAQVTDVVKDALTRAPQLRHLDAAAFILVALEQHWPCKK